MTDQDKQLTPDSSAPEAEGGWSVQRIVIVASVVFILIVLLPFVVGFGLALADIDKTLELFQLIRDIFIIVLAMVSILIALALATLVVQVAGLINLLRNEIKPLLEDIQVTLGSARGTVEFVGDNITDPLVKAGGFVAGTSVFLREMGGLRRAIKPRPQSPAAQPDTEQ